MLADSMHSFNTGTEVYVYATTYSDAGLGTIGFEFDGVNRDNWSINLGEGAIRNTLIFSATNLENEQHRVKMTSLSDTKWFLDYIVYKSDRNATAGPVGDSSGNRGNGDSGSSMGVIVGGTVGGVAFLVTLGLLAVCYLRRTRAQKVKAKEYGDSQSIPMLSTGRKYGSQDDLANAIPTPFIVQPDHQSQAQSHYGATKSKGNFAKFMAPDVR